MCQIYILYIERKLEVNETKVLGLVVAHRSKWPTDKKKERKKTSDEGKPKCLSSSPQNQGIARRATWWLICGMDDASFPCLVYSTSHWSNAHKAFNHVLRPASHFPLLSPVFVRWRQRGDHRGCAGVKHRSGEWTFRRDQPAGLSEKSSTFTFSRMRSYGWEGIVFLGRSVHLQLTIQETQ